MSYRQRSSAGAFESNCAPLKAVLPSFAYLSEPLAAGSVVRPSDLITERMPDGGLLMTATEERLDPSDPEHLGRARILAETVIARTKLSSSRKARGRNTPEWVGIVAGELGFGLQLFRLAQRHRLAALFVRRGGCAFVTLDRTRGPRKL